MSGRVGSITTEIIADGLVFNMDAANRASYPRTGVTWFDTIGTNNGTLVNNPTFSSDGGGSIVFDGNDDRVDINVSGNTLTGLTYGTLSIWFKIPSSTPNITNNLFSLYEDNSNRFGLSIGEATSAHPDESLMAFFQNGGSISYAAITKEGHTYYFDDTWHNIVLTINSGPAPNTKIYMDCQNKSLSYPFGSNMGTGFTNLSPSAIRIGDRVYNGAEGQFFEGNIGPVHIYNRALSSTEVLHNYNALKGRFGLT